MPARCNWTEPADGGAPITQYLLRRNGQALATITAPTRTYLDDSAVVGDTYTVAAVNSAGTGPYSSPAVSYTGPASTAVPPFASNAFTGATSGSITTANSGLNGNTAFDQVALAGASPWTYQAAPDGTAGSLLAMSTTSAASYVGWDVPEGTPTIFCAVDLYLTANPAANWDPIQPRTTAGGVARLRITTAGKLAVVNGSTVVATSVDSVPLNTHVRLEFRCTVSASAGGTLSGEFFTGTSETNTANARCSATGLTTGTTEDLSAVRFGQPAAAAHNTNAYFRRLAMSLTGPVGPIGGSSAPAETIGTPSSISASTSGAGAFTVTWSAVTGATRYSIEVDSGGTPTSYTSATTSLALTGLAAGSYRARVRAEKRNAADTAWVQSSWTAYSSTVAVTSGGGATISGSWDQGYTGTIDADATYFTGGTIAQLKTFLQAIPAGKMGVLDYNGEIVGSISALALQNGAKVVNAPGKRPWVRGGFQITNSNNWKLFGLSVTYPESPASSHVVSFTGGSNWEVAYCEFVNVNCFTIVQITGAYVSPRVHHCHVAGNGVANSANQDHGFYIAGTGSYPNGNVQVDHCLIHNIANGRGIKFGGASDAAASYGPANLHHNTIYDVKVGWAIATSNGAAGPSTFSNNLCYAIQDKNPVMDRAAGTTYGTHTFTSNYSDKTVMVAGSDANSTYVDGGGNLSNQTLASCQDWAARGAAGYGHLAT